jgi:hypothetical protein
MMRYRFKRDDPFKPTVYLAHPYKEKVYGEEVMKKIQALGIDVINPFIRGEQAIYDKVIVAKQEFSDKHAQDIVESDLAKIRAADAIVALVLPVPSIGTFCEIMYNSNQLGRQTFSLYKMLDLNDGKHGWGMVHPWIKYLTEVSFTEDQLYEKLKTWRDLWIARKTK